MKLAILFSGQGSQYVGMGKDLCEKFPVAKRIFEEANDALGFDIKKLCFDGSQEELSKTENSQPAILTFSYAAFKVYMQEFGIVPSYMAGHSLGEYSALVCTGGIKFTDAVKIVRLRGKFMQEAVPEGVGGMAAINGLDKILIEEECRNFVNAKQIVVVSNYNSPEQYVISGHKQGVDILEKKFGEMGAKVIPLKVSAPFHSPLMQPAADKLRQELSKYEYKEFICPIISNVTALPYKNADWIVDNLALQVVRPVRWIDSIEYLKQQDITVAIEMGPQTVLKNLMKKNAPDIKTFSYDIEGDIAALRKEIHESGEQLGRQNCKNMEAVVKCLAIAICTRNKNWNNEEYQKGVIEPYRKIKAMQAKLEEEGREPDAEQVEEALNMLKSVFTTKKTPVDEQIERFNRLMDDTGIRNIIENFALPTI